MENLTPEMIEKARGAKSAEELLAMAKEAGMEDFTEESAVAYFEQLHGKNGELSDDELDNVAGGGCYNGGELVVTVGTRYCEQFECKRCGMKYQCGPITQIEHDCSRKDKSIMGHWSMNICGSCKYCVYKGGLWKCTNPKKRK